MSEDPLSVAASYSSNPESTDGHDAAPRRQLFIPQGEAGVENEEHPGYSIVWDNVGKMVTRSQQSTTGKSVYAMFANSLIIENRIPFTHLEQHDYHRREAITIPVQTFLPNVGD